MKAIAGVVAALLLAAPVAAQQASPEEGGTGSGLFERGVDGLRGFADELRGEVEQWSEGLAGITEEMLPVFRMLAREMGPALVEVFRQIDSIENYESPILTPEGDIVIRRRPDAPPFTPPRTEPAPEADGVDL